MTDEHILKTVPQIIKHIPYYTMMLTNEEYNEKYGNVNMNAMKAILHNKVLTEMAKKYPNYDYIVIDQFAEKYVYYNYLKNIPNVQRDLNIYYQSRRPVSLCCLRSSYKQIYLLKRNGKII